MFMTASATWKASARTSAYWGSADHGAKCRLLIVLERRPVTALDSSTYQDSTTINLVPAYQER